MPKGYATSFADPADVARFKACKAHGLSDMKCYGVGDNGKGEWDDSTVAGSGACCAVPADLIRAKWGNLHTGRNKEVLVHANGKSAVLPVRDIMPLTIHITNGAVIDLNPDACFQLGLKPPVEVRAEWEWV